MPNLLTLTHLAHAMKVPVPYFYCEDIELAQLIADFWTLDKVQKKRLLSSMSELIEARTTGTTR